MFIKALVALTIVLSAAMPACAQGPLGLSPEPADARIREALGSTYAQTLLKTFAASVRKNGDPSCLQAKALDDAALIASGRALLQRRGVQMLTMLDENFDRAAYRSALSASAGAGAFDELERLRRDDNIKKLTTLNRPAQLARVIDSLMEQFDRFVLMGRIKLDPISPVARGEPQSKDNPTQATEAATQRFIDTHRSKKIDRYLDLLDAAEAATPKGFSPQATLKLGPMAYFAGAEAELAEVCVGRR